MISSITSILIGRLSQVLETILVYSRVSESMYLYLNTESLDSFLFFVAVTLSWPNVPFQQKGKGKERTSSSDSKRALRHYWKRR